MQERSSRSSAGARAAEGSESLLPNPYDTLTGAVFRFLMELGAWVLGPWAAVAAGLPWWGGAVVAVVLVMLPALFNARGDKTKEVVLVPGAVRLGIEAFLSCVVLGSATLLWGWPGGLVALAFLVGAAVTGRRRTAWLLGSRS